MAQHKTKLVGRAIGRAVSAQRIKAKMSMGELGRRSGIQITAVSRMERGLHTPTIATLERIAKALEVPIHKLLP